MKKKTSLDTKIALPGTLPTAVISDSMDRLVIPTAVMDPAIALRTAKRLASCLRQVVQKDDPIFG